MHYIILIGFLLIPASVGCQSQSEQKDNSSNREIPKTMIIESHSFKNDGVIPAKYTCSGEDINPPLTISDIPSGTKSLAFILDDPDAPFGTFTHWIMWNISSSTSIIAENSVPTNAIQGKNSAGQNKYFGPCPPSGTHHYHFKIFALDMMLSLPQSTHVKQLQNAMKGHVLATGVLIGIYKK